jgi:hypothetical protein
MSGFEEKYVISKFSVIRRNGVFTDEGQFEFPATDDDGKSFKHLYKLLEIDYPKFYKMDRLCKLAFLSTEYLFKINNLLEKYRPDEVALVFSNANSSLDTDTKHANSISDKKNYFPQPAVFVYTLPNILLGEISIRHKLHGENTFFITENFEAEFMADYVTNLLNTTKHKACLLGRVDYFEAAFDSSVFFIEAATNPLKEDVLSASNLERKFYTFARHKNKH